MHILLILMIKLYGLYKHYSYIVQLTIKPYCLYINHTAKLFNEL